MIIRKMIIFCFYLALFALNAFFISLIIIALICMIKHNAEKYYIAMGFSIFAAFFLQFVANLAALHFKKVLCFCLED